MNKAWRVIRHEFVTNFRRRSYLIVSFVLPLVVVVGVFVLVELSKDRGSGNESESPTAPDALYDVSDSTNVVGIVDHSGQFDPPEPGSPFATYIKQFYDDEAAAREALDAGEIHSYFVITEDYLEDGKVIRYAEQFDIIGGLRNEGNLVRNFLSFQMLQGRNQRVYQRLIDPVNFDIETVDLNLDAGSEEGEAPLGEGALFLLPYVFGMLIFMGTMFGSGYLMTSMVQEKENRVIEIVLSSIKPFPLLLGKVLASGTLGLIQVAVYVVAMWLIAPKLGGQAEALAGLEVPPRLMLFGLAYFVLSFFMIGGLFAALTAMVSRMQEAQQFVGFIILPVVMPPLMFIREFSETPDSALSLFLSLFPITAPMSMVMRLSVADVPAIQIIISLALTALGALGSIWFAARLFRVNTLLAGQAPKLRDLWRLVREDV